MTGALSALLEAEAGTGVAVVRDPETDAIPQAIDGAGASDSDGVLALSEKEIIEASGPIRDLDVPVRVSDAQTERISLPVPPDAFRPEPLPEAAAPDQLAGDTLTDAVRTAADLAAGPDAQERAVQLFDLGIALRAQQRYAEALLAWQQALALAPDNLVYQANVKRLQHQLETAGRT